MEEFNITKDRNRYFVNKIDATTYCITELKNSISEKEGIKFKDINLTNSEVHVFRRTKDGKNERVSSLSPEFYSLGEDEALLLLGISTRFQSEYSFIGYSADLNEKEETDSNIFLIVGGIAGTAVLAIVLIAGIVSYIKKKNAVTETNDPNYGRLVQEESRGA